MRWTRGVMEDTSDGGLVLIRHFTENIPTDVIIAVEAREVIARNLQPDAVA